MAVAYGAEEGATAAQSPSLEELTAVIQPILDKLDLTAEQQGRAKGVMSDDTWALISDGFRTKRRGEIFREAHRLMPQYMRMLIQPKMMQYNMAKNMAHRMKNQLGPPSAEELKAIRDKNRQTMRGKIAPTLMANLNKLADERIAELMADKKVLVRALGEKVSEIVLTEEQQAAFDKALSAAGYPSELIHGADAILIERGKKMAAQVAAEKIEEFKKEDAATPAPDPAPAP